MSKRMFTMATVHFQARADEKLHDRILATVGEAGIPQDVVVTTMREMLLHTARVAAAAQIKVMSEWSPEQWREQTGVRIASALRSDGNDQD